MREKCRLRNLITVATVMLALSSCSFSSTSSPQVAASSAVSGGDGTMAVQKSNPLAFEIDEEVNDGSTVHVRAHVEAQVPVKKSGVAVRLTALHEGEILYGRDYPMRQLLGENNSSAVFIEPHRIYSVELSFPLRLQDSRGRSSAGSPTSGELETTPPEVTDYQLELVWGLGAETSGTPVSSPGNLEPPSVAGRAVGDMDVGAVEFRGAHVEQSPASCENPPCGLLLRVTGDLVNRGEKLISKVTLAVGFMVHGPSTLARSEGGTPEELVTMENLGILPGQSKRVRLVFERPIPANLATIIYPVVRVANVE